MSHCHSLLRHFSHLPPLTPDLTHLYSDHLHLPISNQVSLKSTLHSVIHCPVYRSLPQTVPDYPVLLTCVTYLPVDSPEILQQSSRRCFPSTSDSSAPSKIKTLNTLQDILRTDISIFHSPAIAHHEMP